MSWWSMPVRLLRAYLAMLPRLQAEETMQMALAHALALPAGTRQEQLVKRRLWRELQRRAAVARRGMQGRARSAHEVAALLRLAGVPMDVEVAGG